MWEAGKPVSLKYGGIVLRNLKLSDVDDRFVGMMNDPEVNTHVAVPPNLTREQIVEHIRQFDNRRGFFFGIFAEESAECIGYARVLIDPADVATWTLVIGDRRYWQGGASVVISYVLRKFLFEEVGIHKIVAKAYGDNKATLAALKKSDYVYEGTLREAEPDGRGGRRDVVIYGQLRSEWEDKPPRKAFTPPPAEGA